MQRCKLCGRELNTPADDIVSRDCGGDCLVCMAHLGDPDCIKAIGQLYAQVLLDELSAVRHT